MCGIDAHVVGQGEQLLVEAIVEQGGELLGGVIGREIGAADIADEERVAGEHGAGARRAVEIGDHDADALERMAGSFEEAQAALAEGDLVAIVDGGCGNRAAARAPR